MVKEEEEKHNVGESFPTGEFVFYLYSFLYYLLLYHLLICGIILIKKLFQKSYLFYALFIFLSLFIYNF